MKSPYSLPVPSKSLEQYLQEINRYPLLTVEQERTHAHKWVEEKDLDAAHVLTTSNLRFVVKISYEYRRYGLRLMDLIQEGNVGLIMAIKKYDPTKGVRLISYAVWWIRAQIQNYILQNWRLVKIGTTQAQRKLFYNLEKTKRMLLRIHGNQEAVSRERIAEALNVKESLVEEMEQRLGNQEMSLEGSLKVDGEEGRSLKELIADESTPSQEELLGASEFEEVRRRHLHHALLRLSDRERHIIERRRLISSPHTLSVIGKDLGITRERVRQLEARAFKKLHAFLVEGGIEEMLPKEKVSGYKTEYYQA
jgi:RNA polymerase sigma-32 factor